MKPPLQRYVDCRRQKNKFPFFFVLGGKGGGSLIHMLTGWGHSRVDVDLEKDECFFTLGTKDLKSGWKSPLHHSNSSPLMPLSKWSLFLQDEVTFKFSSC